MDTEDFLTKLIEQTNEKAILWEPESVHAYNNIIFQNDFVYKIFSSEYQLNEKMYKLIFLEKKIPDFNNDFIENYYPELLILENNRLISEITSNNADRNSLILLGTAITNNNTGFLGFLNALSDMFKK